jgi:predicted anti-sigma-YlaC factor YlaD
VDAFVMMTCQEVSTLVSSGDLQAASLGRRLGVGVHLAMCRHCRAFRRQVTAIGEAARALNGAYRTEPRAAFEADLVQRLFR